MEIIIITPRSLSNGDHPLLKKLRDVGYQLVFPSPGRQPTEKELVAVIGDAVGYVAGVEPITAATLSAASKLRVISRNGTGIDNIDVEAAAQRHIIIRKADGANARGVAELAVGLMIAAARGIPASDRNLKAERWKRSQGFELEGKTLGIIGVGKIGKLVSGFALAFGMKVLAYDPYPDYGFVPSPDFSFVALEELLKRADIVTLHCPPLPDRKPLISKAQMATMRHGVIIINTARQSLVDEAALVRNLDSGAVAWYAIDAFDREPPEDFSLAKHERVIVTPHIGGFTAESVERAAEVAIDNLLDTLRKA